MIAVATLVLGLPLPITATYLIVAVVAVPALLKLGVPMLPAHLLIFWLSLDSNITPPVAMGPFAAAAIAQADPMKTGWACFSFAKIIYVMPVLFAYTHILLTGTPAQNIARDRLSHAGHRAFFHREHWIFLRQDQVCSSGCFWPLATVLAFIPTSRYGSSGDSCICRCLLMATTTRRGR